VGQTGEGISYRYTARPDGFEQFLQNFRLHGLVRL
jgi:hypothetical protein